MPRGKKTRETTNKKNRKIEEEDEENIDEIIDEETPKKKSAKKASMVTSKTSKKGKKPEIKEDIKEADSEDDLSDLDVDDEDTLDDNDRPVESAENDTVVSSQKHERPPRKIIDPKTPIGQLSIQDGLNYYIQLGEESCNPQLKFGALNLLKQLTGRRRRYPPTFGSKTNRNFNPRGGFQQRRGGGIGRQMQKSQTRGVQNSNEDLYGDPE
jgi:hypothetical protein